MSRQKQELLPRDLKRVMLVLLASALMAVNIKTFVRTGGLYPAPQHFVPDPQSMMLMLYCAAGSTAIRFPESIEQLIGKEALLLEGDEITSVDLAISAGGCVVAAEIWSI